MRLVCPNCGAQYEVADDAIPRGGRDVQCSNCGHTWFQVSGRAEAGAPPVPAASAPVRAAATRTASLPATPVPTPEPPPNPNLAKAAAPSRTASPIPGAALPPDPTVAPTRRSGVGPHADPEPASDPMPYPEADPEPLPDADPEPETDDVPEPPAIAAQRSFVSPAIARILREEAEREESARRADVAALESQPDLGLDAAPGFAPARTPAPDFDPSPGAERLRAEEARQRMAILRGQKAAPEPQPTLPVAHAPPPTRRDLLPDIEKINSTLRSAADRAAETPTVETIVARGRRRGFRAGFMTVLVMALLLAVIYVLADPIAQALPVMQPPLESYVAVVDEGRLWLDLRLQELLIILRGADTATAAD